MKRVLRAGTGEVVEKKSRFIAVAMNVESAEDAAEKVNIIRKKYYDARHNCYAYICGADGAEKRFSDDGEPSGTAGKPMMDVLEGSGVTNCLVVVTRYFGGTLLGTGGLVKAYSSAAKLAIENAGLTEVAAGVRCRIEADYNSLGKLQYLLASLDVPVLDTLYEQNVVLDLVVADDMLRKLEKRLQDDFAGRLALECGDSVQFYRSEGTAIIL
jgi:uncharacterized YigZ family protein